MDRKAPAGRGYPRYYCIGRKNGATECPGVAEGVLLKYVLARIAQLEQSAFNPNNVAEKTRGEIAFLQGKLRDVEARAEKMLDLLEQSNASPLLLGRLKTLDKDKSDTQEALEQAQSKLAAIPLLDRDFGKKLAGDAAAIVADKDDAEGRQKVSQALWQVVKKIVWNGKFFMVHVRNGSAFGVIPPADALGRARNRNAGKPRTA